MQQRDERLREQVQVALSRYVVELLGITRRLMLAETAAEKLASLLLRWCDEFGSMEPHGIRLVWEFTHEDVAQMLCVSRETVTRLLGEFSKRLLVLLTGNSLLVNEPQGLEEIAAGKMLISKQHGENIHPFCDGLKLNRRLDWNFGYQYYNYNESTVVGPRPQNYHAHLPYTSMHLFRTKRVVVLRLR